jgi:hypothetical protein
MNPAAQENSRNMKTHIPHLFAVVALLVPFTSARCADEIAPANESKKELRVLASPEKGRRVMGQMDSNSREKVEKETVAFLGVSTAPVSATIRAQLGLPRGTGLAVNHIVPKSAAVGVLEPHDILLKMDDQILIEVRQLSVLIRNHKVGDEVVLTYLRGGQKATAKVKLGKTEETKTAEFGYTTVPFGAAGAGGSRFELFAPSPDPDRAHVDHLLGLIQRAPKGEPFRIQIDRNAGPGFRAMAVNTGNSNLVFSDDQGSLELTTSDGAKTLVAKTADGKELFSGPVSSAEERAKLPAGVRERLEQLEGMHDVTFRTDGDFKGTESRVVRPREIAAPFARPFPMLEHQAIFY